MAQCSIDVGGRVSAFSDVFMDIHCSGDASLVLSSATESSEGSVVVDVDCDGAADAVMSGVVSELETFITVLAGRDATLSVDRVRCASGACTVYVDCDGAAVVAVSDVQSFLDVAPCPDPEDGCHDGAWYAENLADELGGDENVEIPPVWVESNAAGQGIARVIAHAGGGASVSLTRVDSFFDVFVDVSSSAPYSTVPLAAMLTVRAASAHSS